MEVFDSEIEVVDMSDDLIEKMMMKIHNPLDTFFRQITQAECKPKLCFAEEADSDVDSDDPNIIVLEGVDKLNYEKSMSEVDIIINDKGSNVGVCSSPGVNPTIGTKVTVDAPCGFPMKRKKMHFRKGCNVHFLTATWGKTDQLCFQQMKVMRLLTALEMLKSNDEVSEAKMGLRLVYERLAREQRLFHARLIEAQDGRERVNEMLFYMILVNSVI